MALKMDKILGEIREKDEIGSVLPNASETTSGITKRDSTEIGNPPAQDVAVSEAALDSYLSVQGFVRAADMPGFSLSTFQNDCVFVSSNDFQNYDLSQFRNDNLHYCTMGDLSNYGYVTNTDLPSIDLGIFSNNAGFLRYTDLNGVSVSTFYNDAGYTSMQAVTALDVSTFSDNGSIIPHNFVQLNDVSISSPSNGDFICFVNGFFSTVQLASLVGNGIEMDAEGRLSVPDSSNIGRGIIQIADENDIASGTENTKAVTPMQLAVECAKCASAPMVESAGPVTNSYNADASLGDVHDITLNAGTECVLTTGNIPCGYALTLRVDNNAGGSLTLGTATLVSTTETGVYLLCFVNVNGTIEYFGKTEREATA